MTKLEFIDRINDILVGLNTLESDLLGSLYDELMRSQWIPVEERLPENNTQVLAYNGKFNEVHLVDYRSGIFEDYYGAFNKGIITHWMPLPEAPRKEE